jgi:hypothetical protein
MGDLQTFFYLGLIAVTILSLAFLLIGLSVAGLRRWVRSGGSSLTAWLIGSAIALVLLVLVLGTAGVLYGFTSYAR